LLVQEKMAWVDTLIGQTEELYKENPLGDQLRKGGQNYTEMVKVNYRSGVNKKWWGPPATGEHTLREHTIRPKTEREWHRHKILSTHCCRKWGKGQREGGSTG